MAPVEVYSDGELEDKLESGQSMGTGIAGRESFFVQSMGSGGKYAKGVLAGLFGTLACDKDLQVGETVDLGRGVVIKGV